MSCFVNSNFVIEFAYRTKSNYYSLMIAQAKELNLPVQEEEYKNKLKELQKEMEKKQYRAKDNYFEVTQLINSLIGLLIFPEQAYFEDLQKLSMEKDLFTLNRITRENEHFCCTYKKTGSVTLSDAQKARWYKGDKEEVSKEVFSSLPPEDPFIILRRMRNAAAHEKVMIWPVSDNKRITSVVFEDYGEANLLLKRNNKKECFSVFYKYPNDNKQEDASTKAKQKDAYTKAKQGDPLYGYFKLEIPIEDLESVLIEISDAISKIAQTG